MTQQHPVEQRPMNTLQHNAPRRRDQGRIYRLSSKVAPRLAAWVRRRLFFDDLKQYEELVKLRHPSFIWMNFGLDGTDFSWLLPEDLEWKYQTNMAHHNLRGLDLTGQRFLDTGSGRGGNCWYVRRYHNPSRLVGLGSKPGTGELVPRAVSQQRHRVRMRRRAETTLSGRVLRRGVQHRVRRPLSRSSAILPWRLPGTISLRALLHVVQFRPTLGRAPDNPETGVRARG